MKPTIITIAGALGSGKSSSAKRIASDLGYTRFSSGDLFRAIAIERNISVEEVNLRAEEEREIDYAVDQRLRDMATESNLVIDSRMAFHWMPDSFKVFLALDPHIAGERIHKHITTEGRVGEQAESIEAVYTSIVSRRESEQRRYMNLYQINVQDLTAFDVVINTATKDLDGVVAEVIQKYKKWLAS